MNPNDASGPPIEPEGKQLCRSCAALNEPAADFCVKCGAPISWYSTIGPFESIFAQGFVYREAAERPRRFIVVLGIWLIFLPPIIAGLVIMSNSDGLLWDAMGAGMILIALGIISRTTWNYFARIKPAHNGGQTQSPE